MERQYQLRRFSSFDVTMQRRLRIHDRDGEQYITVLSPDPAGTFNFHFISLIQNSFGNPISLWDEDHSNNLWIKNDEGQFIGFITPYNAITRLKFIQTFCDTKRYDIATTSSLSGLFE